MNFACDSIESMSPKKLRMSRKLSAQQRELSKQAFFSLKPSPYGVNIGHLENVRDGNCKRKKVNRTIHVEGCEDKVIQSTMCYGHCNSFYIPESVQIPNDDDISYAETKRILRRFQNQKVIPNTYFKYCYFCGPVKFRKINVTIQCGEDYSVALQKRIEIIAKCDCQGGGVQ